MSSKKKRYNLRDRDAGKKKKAKSSEDPEGDFDSDTVITLKKSTSWLEDLLAEDTTSGSDEEAQAEAEIEFYIPRMTPDMFIQPEIKKLSKHEKKILEGIKKKSFSFDLKDILNAPLSKEAKYELYLAYIDLKALSPTDELYSPIFSYIKKVLKPAMESGIPSETFESFEDRIINVPGTQKNILNRLIEKEDFLGQKATSIIYERYKAIEGMPSGQSVMNAMEWIEEMFKIPFNHIEKPVALEGTEGREDFLINLRRGLDKELFGLDLVKESIMSVVNNSLNDQGNPLIIAMLGSPGTGKTEIARSVATVLGLPFEQISLGGMIDSSILDGHSGVWLGSKPGAIVRALQKMGCRNGVIFLDEIDKLCCSTHGLEVQNGLLRILDKTQNEDFKDHYVGENVSINLKDIVFIVAMNSKDTLDPALISRLPIINIPDYTVNEKIKIMKDFIKPKILKEMHMDLLLSDDNCRQIIKAVENIKGPEGGLRGCRDLLAEILNKVSLIRNLKKEFREEIKLYPSLNFPNEGPVILSSDDINTLCAKNKVSKEIPSLYM